MHIVFVCSEYPYKKNQATGGFGRYVDNISQGLAAMGQKVSIVCRVKEKRSKVNRGKVEIIPIVPFGAGLLREITSYVQISIVHRLSNFMIFPILWSFSVWLTLRRINKECKIDVIEGGDFGAELFFYLLFREKIPTVIKLHTPSFILRKYNREARTLFYRVMEFMEKYCLKRATSLNSPSNGLAKLVSKEINRPVPDIIPYPVEKISVQRIKKRDNNLVLYVGKHQPKKGVFILLKAIPQVLKKIPEAKFIFIGPDTRWRGESVKKKIKDFIDQNKLNHAIRVYEEATKGKIVYFYQRAAVTVIPSLWENFPNVCLEAMSYGSAVVATRVGGLAEIVENEKTGLLVEPNNPLPLAQSIVYLLTNTEKREELAKNANKRIKERYSLKTISQQTIAYYKGLIKR